jgi:hypothetical protein
MKQEYRPRVWGIAAGFLAALTFGLTAGAQAQDLTPVLNVPMDNPRIYFDGTSSSQIVYDPDSTLLTFDAVSTYIEQVKGGGAVFFQSESSTFIKTFHIRARVDHTGHHVRGIEPGDPNDVCGGGRDFCVTGTWGPFSSATDPNGALLYGEIVGIGAANNLDVDPVFGLNRDHFEFLIRITGGVLQSLASPGYPAGWNTLVVSSESIASPGLVEFDGDFRKAFAGAVDGNSGPTNAVGFLGQWDNCNGQIAGRVQNALSLSGLSDIAITLSGGYLSTSEKANTDANGAYSFSNLCAGSYQVEASTPQWYAPLGLNVAPVTLVTDTASNDSSNNGVNFSFYQTGAVNSAYTTFTQSGWGAKPKGQNPGAVLATYFGIVATPDGTPDGSIVIGGNFTLSMSGAAAIQRALPQNGKAMPLTKDYADPVNPNKPKAKAHTQLGSLAGEVLALELNLRFSTASLTRNGLGSLRLASGPLAGQTVNQVRGLGNSVLGGAALPTILKKYDDLADIIEKINKNFEAGSIDKHYLVP